MNGMTVDFYLLKNKTFNAEGFKILALSTGNDNWMGAFLTAQAMRLLLGRAMDPRRWMR